MFTNELVKGIEVRLRNGFRAVVKDNQKRQMTRICMVYGSELGMFDEMGSVYASDIVQAKIDGQWVRVTPTEKQIAAQAQRHAFGF